MPRLSALAYANIIMKLKMGLQELNKGRQYFCKLAKTKPFDVKTILLLIPEVERWL